VHVCARAAGFGFGKGGKTGVEMVCRGDVCTSNERQGYSHDPGNPVVGASERDIGKPDNSNSHEFELHRPSNKGTKLLLKVIKAIIIIVRSTTVSFGHEVCGTCLYLNLSLSDLSIT